ncbi:GNAT family N-acetyltransferase [Streptomyces venezuelae]|uniref:GNAT family N-acetyltransferase n=1 Tax=Streptomyces venezuelae TaxID=54571 RepID=A0A5P2D486_STRVZ|nr:GNAT family N-acetyltransferase [Streptomyces venezuelae]QES49370.1 GNAT family N-acetyltransferase [Streptomyces venezuelae]
MIEILSHDRLPTLAARFPTAAAGPGALVEHVLETGTGRWWADRAEGPRVLAVSCGDQVLLRGDPGALAPGALAPFALSYVEAPSRFGGALWSAFDRVTPWERMVYVHQQPAASHRVPRGVTVRRLTAADTAALAAFTGTGAAAGTGAASGAGAAAGTGAASGAATGTGAASGSRAGTGVDGSWILGSWGGPERLAATGCAWAAFAEGRIAALACTRFRGSAYDDVAVLTHPDHRRRHLALACVAGLTGDIAARGRTASWCCSRDNRASRLLAWTAGFRLVREYVHHVTGRPALRGVSGSRIPA